MEHSNLLLIVVGVIFVMAGFLNSSSVTGSSDSKDSRASIIYFVVSAVCFMLAFRNMLMQ